MQHQAGEHENMVGQFHGRVAVITGAAAGMGAATARRLASEGASVVIADIDLTAGQSVAREIGDAGGKATAILADIGDDRSVAALFEATVAAYGGVDLLVNNAFAASPDDLDLVSTPLPAWDRIYNINVLGAVRCCRLAIPLMIARGGGAIVSIASGSGLWAEQRRIAYGSSKAALAHLTRGIATQFGPQGIRANSIAPGFTATASVMAKMAGREDMIQQVIDHTPLRRIARPEELAAMICMLLSDDASFVTGVTLPVDGGRRSMGGAAGDAKPLQELPG
jgi:NAD(P)-dependent dehydrogenase (short-subunit alcohol dehydrogenase family)